MSMVATLTSKGQITIPAGVRKRLSLHTGDKVAFVVAENRAEMIPLSQPVQALKTILPKPRKRLSLAEMEAAMARAARS